MTTNLDTSRPAGARRVPRLASLALAGGIVAGGLGLAACGSGTPAGGSPVPLASSPLSRPGAARAAAEAILAELKLPPGLRLVGSEPAGDGGRLAVPSTRFADPNLVDVARFAVGGVDPESALQWLRAHPPAGSSVAGDGRTTGPDSWPTLWLTFSWPAVGQLLDTRELVVSATELSSGGAGLRFDAQVTWLPAKPAADRVPAGVTVLTVSLTKGPNPGEPGHALTTTTDPAVIAAIRDRINGLSVARPGVTSCPMDVGQVLTLKFYDKAGGTPVAVVSADPGGCGFVGVEVGGKAVSPALAGDGLASFVEAEMGWSTNA